MTERIGPTGVRFAYVDALRGIAALLVVLLHLYHYNLVPMTGYVYAEPFHAIFDNGHIGVYVFFVISGFVIAQSIHGSNVTGGFIGRFVLRRAVRLDIPYWATIVAMIVLTLISNNMQSERSLPVPGAGSILSHLVYTQRFFGYDHIVGVFWTLCYEVQFYLALILLTGAAQHLDRQLQLPAWLRSPWVVFLPVWIASLVCATGRLDISEAVALYCWPYFFLGVVANWVHNKSADTPALLSVALGTVATVALVDRNHHFTLLEVCSAIVTALSIWFVSKQGRLASLTLGAVLQYLGRISYSLYLSHMLVGTPAMRFGIRLFGKQPTLLQSIALILLSLAISIVAAHVMHVLVERPATKLSKRFRAA